jgi:uncharacterized paraquat-inducible protein A
MIGKKGIFISDEGREQLNITLSQEEFNKLKDVINKEHDPKELKKCYLTNKYYSATEGLFLDKIWMANAIEKNITSQEKLYDKYKNDKIVVCSSCGIENKYDNNIIKCNKCGLEINTKKYGKSIKLNFAKKISIKLYIKYLRGDKSF